MEVNPFGYPDKTYGQQSKFRKLIGHIHAICNHSITKKKTFVSLALRPQFTFMLAARLMQPFYNRIKTLNSTLHKELKLPDFRNRSFTVHLNDICNYSKTIKMWEFQMDVKYELDRSILRIYILLQN